MSDSGNAIWWVFVAGVLALAVILVGFIVALVISQRRVLRVERDHARRLLEAQEAERAWVAREVHDDALQRVMVVRAELELLRSESQARSEDLKKLAAVTVELDDLSYLLRTVAHRLHPSMLEQAGLVAGLRSLVNESDRSLGLTVTLDAPEAAPPLKPDVALAAYRIAQEALRNVTRHANVSTARLGLSVADGWMTLRVSDAGRGFAPGKDAGRDGLGLIAMQERAALAGGRFRVTSQPGRGTLIEVAFPMTES